MLIALLLIYIVLLIINYIFYKKEITSPSIIFCFTYIISFFCAILNIKNWNINFRVNTFLVFLIGGLLFVITANLIYSYFRKKRTNKQIDMKKIVVPRKILLLLLLYEVIVIILLLNNVLFIASKYGTYKSLPQALNIFKEYTSYKGLERLPRYLTVLLKPIYAGAYISIFIFLNNIFVSLKNKKIEIFDNIVYLIFPVMYCLQRYFESNRGSILNLIICTVVLAIILWSQSYDWKKTLKLKVIGALATFGVAGLFVFYLSAGITGRITDKNSIDYITMYVGGSIECFNIWMENPDEPYVVRGEYTFERTIEDLNEFGITHYKLKNDKISERLFYKETFIGNIYTAYRSWIHDYGYIGAILLQIIFAATMTALYCCVRFYLSPKYHNYILILYGFLIYTVFMHPIDTYFYYETFTKSNFAVLFVMFIFYYIIEKNEKKKKNKMETKNKYIICEGLLDGKYNATNKARNDAENIALSLGYERLAIPTTLGIRKTKIGKILQLFSYAKNNIIWKKSLKKLNKDDIVLIQYPLTNTVLFFDSILKKYNNKVSFIILIHDLDSLRLNKESSSFVKRKKHEDKYIINNANYVICHNNSMKKAIEKNGRNNNLIVLEIFDYLYDGNIKNDCSIDKPIIIAGNLSPSKAGYLGELKNVKNASFNLYGVGLDKNCLSNNVEYKGAYKPEELLNNLSGSFGLVWDGETIEDCRGGFGEYLKYNNPHKVSMYLTAGIPVIVWEKSAMASFVKKNNVGFAISNLNDISKVIKKMTKDEYKTMRKNCNTISKKLKRGYFLQSAIEKIEKQ